MLPSCSSTSSGATSRPPTSPNTAPQQHPLNNLVVLQEIFKNLKERHSIKSARLVCKFWRDVIEPEWRSVTDPLTLVQDERVQYMSRDELEGTIKLSDFLQQQSRGSTPIHTRANFILKNWEITEDQFSVGTGDESNVKLMRNRQFWTIFGDDICFLTLNGGEVDFLNVNPKENQSLLRVVPNVQRLTFQNCHIHISKETENGYTLQDLTHPNLKYIRFENVSTDDNTWLLRPQIWEIMFSVLPNLTEISAKGQPWLFHGIFTPAFKKIKNDVKNFKTLDIINMDHETSRFYYPHVMKYNSQGHFSLHTLTLDCGHGPNSKYVQVLLNKQSGNLETLHLYRAPFDRPYDSLPCGSVMPNLTELHLWGNVSKNLNFLQLTPKLRVFKWNTSCYTDNAHDMHLDYEFKYAGTPFMRKKYRTERCVYGNSIVESTNELLEAFKLDTMTTLEIEWGPTSLESWKKLGTWMPNLRTLKGVVCGDDQIAFISKQWPYLDSLQLACGSHNTDENDPELYSYSELIPVVL